MPQVQALITAEAMAIGLTSFTDDQILWAVAIGESDIDLRLPTAGPKSIAAIVARIVAFTDLIEQGLGGHMNAVGALAIHLAERIGASRAMTRTCGIAGQLHDIGKVVVPANIVRKPGALSAAEYAAIKMHSSAGDHLLRGIPSLATYAPIVRSHHERIDGTGYPDGIAGNDIPLEARIIAVADAFDAMTSSRVYRAPTTELEAIRIIVDARGRHFDVAIVDALLDVLRVPRRAVA